MNPIKKYFLTVALFVHVASLAQVENYPVDSASVERASVPKGEIIKFVFNRSKIFPGTTREVSVYVPPQYKPGQPACVYVNQDGVQWKAPTVFDNLIFNKEMPVTIGIFITPGLVMADSNGAQHRYNRSFEYDGLGDGYARFLLTEIFPEVEAKTTTDGRAIRLSKNGNDRAIGGSSSGAVCAFTAAWEHPEEFSKVFSAIGTYVGLRGADRYSTLVRKCEPKPIRIFLQDGSNDLNIYAGDWWMANQMMERSLSFAGYEVNHIWGEGRHSGGQGTALFPAAMRWLWKDWPKRVANGISQNQFLKDLLVPDENWQLVGDGYKAILNLSATANGDVFYRDKDSLYRIGSDGKHTVQKADEKPTSIIRYGGQGKKYVLDNARKQLWSYYNEKKTLVAAQVSGNDFTVAANGTIYLLSSANNMQRSKISLLKPDGTKQQVDEGLLLAKSVAITPDQKQLMATESATHWVWIYKIAADGSLTHKQRYGWLHVPDTEENAGGASLVCDTAGRVYVATASGIQVMDQLGRVNAILPVPDDGAVTAACFGGANLDELFAVSSNKLYRRKLKTTGIYSFSPAIKPGIPKL